MKAMGRFESVNQMLNLRFPKEFTKSYVDALSSGFSDKVVLNSQIKSIARDDSGVTLRMENGDESVFDKVVFACNADQALALLERPTEDEKRLLGAWKYKDGLMTVHTDNSCFPPRDLCQSWTALQSGKNGTSHYSISICTWRACPGTSNKSEYFSTQHLDHPIARDRVDFEKTFRTPVYDFQSFRTIEELPSLNGKMNSYYCGSHFGFGLHNDAVKSALVIARMLK
jgi:predicted NAD/FAD-binding protein